MSAVLIVAHHDRAEAAPLAAEVARWLRERGHQAIMTGDDAAAHWAARTRARRPGVAVDCTEFRHPLSWTSNPFANNEMVPAEALQKMMSEIHGHP